MLQQKAYTTLCMYHESDNDPGSDIVLQLQQATKDAHMFQAVVKAAQNLNNKNSEPSEFRKTLEEAVEAGHKVEHMMSLVVSRTVKLSMQDPRSVFTLLSPVPTEEHKDQNGLWLVAEAHRQPVQLSVLKDILQTICLTKNNLHQFDAFMHASTMLKFAPLDEAVAKDYSLIVNLGQHLYDTVSELELAEVISKFSKESQHFDKPMRVDARILSDLNHHPLIMPYGRRLGYIIDNIVR